MVVNCVDSRHTLLTVWLGLQIKDSMGNEHGRPRDIAGEVRQAFTSTADTAFDVCLENQLSGRRKFPTVIQTPVRRLPASSLAINPR